MRELYIEGVAIHGGPESCGGVREGVGEALTGVLVGGAIEPRKASSGCRRCTTERKARSTVAVCEWPLDPARSENLGMRGISMRENREARWSPSRCGAWMGREGKAVCRSPR